MRERLLWLMRAIANETMPEGGCGRSDFEQYTARAIAESETADFPYFWIVGESHSNLASVGELLDSFAESEQVRYRFVQRDSWPLANIRCAYPDDKIFLVTEQGCVQMTKEQAFNAYDDLTLPAARMWEAENGKLPAKFKIRVEFAPSLTIGKFMQLVRDCEAHGDSSLIDILRRYRDRLQLAADHVLRVGYCSDSELYFGEYVNGQLRLNGGIIFLGWPETGYQVNNSVQLCPSYGWQMHT